jgi:hypothetical protein
VKPGTHEQFATSGASGEPVAASGRTKWRGLVEARAGSRLAIRRTAVYGLGTLSADREGSVQLPLVKGALRHAETSWEKRRHRCWASSWHSCQAHA